MHEYVTQMLRILKLGVVQDLCSSKSKDLSEIPISNSSILGYIDLSKRRVSQEDVEKCTERYSKSKAVNSILRHVAELLKYESDEQLEELYQKTAWHFEEKHKNKTAAYDIFKQCVM